MILVSAMALGSGTLVLTTHAADQAGPAAAAQPTQGAQLAAVPPQAAVPVRTASNAAAPGPTAPNPTAAKPPATKAPAPGAPQVPEESATIRDDPTIAPDPKQSADNNVSFPNDI